jgi:hypothetical protein
MAWQFAQLQDLRARQSPLAIADRVEDIEPSPATEEITRI